MEENQDRIIGIARLLPGELVDLTALEKQLARCWRHWEKIPDARALVRTPERVARMYAELLRGYRS